jgi:signal transduction histidine kinase/DNA-binding response OmpR family regulator
MQKTPELPFSFLQGGGELGELIRAKDWSATPLGPSTEWPQSLKTTLGIMLNSRYPMFVFWGPQLVKIYNDGYRPITGHKHPWALGRPAREVWPEIWADIKPLVDRALGGDPTFSSDLLLFMERNGFPEEVYFTFSYSPVPDESGGVGGMFCACTETTPKVLGERRLQILRELAAAPAEARTITDACALSAEVLSSCPADVPFAVIYLAEKDGAVALAAQAGVSAGDAIAPRATTVDEAARGWPLHAVATLRIPQQVSPLAGRFDAIPAGPWPEPPSAAMVLPLVDRGLERAAGVIVLGISSRRPFDAEYRGWFALVSGQISANLANARAYEEEKRRAEALAEVDRAKTAFFSNVSHEFRTPLTLMLGPTEDALASPDRALRGEDLETVHRNELRLLKLVNTLLDFSRVEAGRASPTFEPTDLAVLTSDLASAFRSAIERAGLRLVVDCPPLPAPVHVDRGMWEKIVLNLLSNAFKFTFHGSIVVELQPDDGHVELRVRDTGIGIAADDIEHIFDRFRRVKSTAARTQEGSGIGLALVRELVTIHGGTIHASSVPGAGSVLSVRLPAGTARASADGVARSSAHDELEATAVAAPYVEEALRWLPAAQAAGAGTAHLSAPPASARILVADDNADMRDYLSRLLSPRFHVETVGDGMAVLDAVRRDRPDVIVSDVMMPGLDGFQLLAALRADDQTRTVPIILVSARAGEEARIEGLQAGADDYLVKPFSARELVARVEAQLVRAKMRSLEEAHAVRLASVFAHAPVGVAILNGPEHVFEFANLQYQELVGGRHVVGKPVREALPELAEQGVCDLLDQVYQSGEPFVGRSRRMVIQRRPPVAEDTFFDFVYQPLFDDRHQVTALAIVAFDVTELTNAKREAEGASRAKDEFLAMLGHELRNPLAPILTALQLMRLRNVTGGQRERMIIERQVKHVVTLVDDLLDVSRITRGKVQLTREPVDLADIVIKAIEMTSPAVEERRHTLHVEVPRGVVVDGDAARLSQVVANLLTNAAKYTDVGGTIAVRGGVDESMARLQVVDTGRGIAPEMLSRIFELFSQERQEIDRSAGGLGLGLAIVRSLVEAHGGSVAATSEGKGRGAEFTIRLPLSSRAAASHGDPARASATRAEHVAAGRRVLVVDDNRDAAELLADSLRALGHTARVAVDGPSAVQAAGEFRPDVALLDLGLPVMDGFELAHRLKARPGLAHLQLVAITGYGQESDRQRTREAGFDAHLVKPVELERLESWLRRGEQQLGETPPPPA